jgi:hypothetical protein
VRKAGGKLDDRPMEVQYEQESPAPGGAVCRYFWRVCRGSGMGA